MDLRAALDGANPVPERVATIRVHAGAATGLRRMAGDTPQPDDPALIAVPYDSLRRLSTAVSFYGPDVEVLGPPEARAAVADRLRDLAAWAAVS